MRRFTKDCHKAGVVVHGTFILGLPVETKETIEQQKAKITVLAFATDNRVQANVSTWYPGSVGSGYLVRLVRDSRWHQTVFDWLSLRATAAG